MESEAKSAVLIIIAIIILPKIFLLCCRNSFHRLSSNLKNIARFNMKFNLTVITLAFEDQIIDKINQIVDAIEADPLYSEVRILDWILHKVYSNEIKKV
jgi:hypothetical protein